MAGGGWQVDDDAAPEVIKVAYRALAKSCHPDFLGQRGAAGGPFALLAAVSSSAPCSASIALLGLSCLHPPVPWWHIGGWGVWV